MRILAAAMVLMTIPVPAAATIFEDGRVELYVVGHQAFPPAISQPGSLYYQINNSPRVEASGDWSSPDAGSFGLSEGCYNTLGYCFAGANWQYSFFATGDGVFTMNWRYNIVNYKEQRTDIFDPITGQFQYFLLYYRFAGAQLTFGEQQFNFNCLSDYDLCTNYGTSTMALVKGQHYRVAAMTYGDVRGFNETYSDFAGDWAITYVPEPASWALMIAGFGMVGLAMRRRATAVTA